MDLDLNQQLAKIKDTITKLSEELESMPLGSIQRKRINYQEYYYRVWRERGTKKLKYKNLGSVTLEKAEKYKKEKTLKESMRQQIKGLKSEKARLDREIKRQNTGK